jgi:hypothetical protein
LANIVPKKLNSNMTYKEPIVFAATLESTPDSVAGKPAVFQNIGTNKNARNITAPILPSKA